MYRLHGYRSARFDFSLNRSEALDNCFSIVIGPNGTGKSRLLGELARTALSDDSGYRQDETHPPTRVLAISNLVTDVFPFVQANSSAYRYLGLRQASNSMSSGAATSSLARYWAEIRVDQPFDFNLGSVLDYLGLPPASLAVKRGVRPTAAKNARESLRRMLSRNGHEPIEWAIDDLDGAFRTLSDELRAMAKAEQSDYAVVSLVGRLATESGLDVGTVVDALRRIYSVRLDMSFGLRSARPFEPSAGQTLLLSMALRLVASLRPDSLVLIDEPETGLHPNWQSDFVRFLESLLPTGMGCHFLIATHSPYVAAGGTNILTPSVEGGFEELETEHQGMSVESMIYRVFQTRVVGSETVDHDLTLIINWLGAQGEAPTQAVRRAAQNLSRLAGPDTTTVNDVLAEFEAKAGHR